MKMPSAFKYFKNTNDTNFKGTSYNGIFKNTCYIGIFVHYYLADSGKTGAALQIVLNCLSHPLTDLWFHYIPPVGKGGNNRWDHTMDTKRIKVQGNTLLV